MAENETTVFAWCVLPNHYHLLVETSDLKRVKKKVGQLHGRTAREWNLAEKMVGRTVWHNCADRAIRSERHYWATVNYIHNNPVHHGYVRRWMEWPFSSAKAYLEAIGREKAEAIWREFPVRNYGQGWDSSEL
jgi:putative transposase